MRLAIILIFLFTINPYCQNENLDCDSLFSTYDRCIYVEKAPEIIGGLGSLQSRLIYPQYALGNKIEGKVYVLALIDSIGNLLCSKVIKGIGFGCDEEALILVNTSRFKPAIQKGNPYTAPLSIPIKFKIIKRKLKMFE